jgi:hypothetical protein
MDIAQPTPPMFRNSHSITPPEAHHSPRTDSLVSTSSGGTPENSKGKTSMDVEQNIQPGSNGFTQPATHDDLLTAPNR